MHNDNKEEKKKQRKTWTEYNKLYRERIKLKEAKRMREEMKNQLTQKQKDLGLTNCHIKFIFEMLDAIEKRENENKQ